MGRHKVLNTGAASLGKKQNEPFIFFFTNVWQKVDLIKICAVKSDKQK